MAVLAQGLQGLTDDSTSFLSSSLYRYRAMCVASSLIGKLLLIGGDRLVVLEEADQNYVYCFGFKRFKFCHVVSLWCFI